MLPNFVSVSSWLASCDEDMKQEYVSTLNAVCELCRKKAKNIREQIKKITGGDIVVEICEDRLISALIAALDDIARVREYHNVIPNPIKKAAYFTYWFSRYKPLTVIWKGNVDLSKLTELARWRLRSINEYIAAIWLMAATFPNKAESSLYPKMPDEVKQKAREQYKTFANHLMYYLEYRVMSPKSLESILLASTTLPLYEPDKAIWKVCK
mgnify:CR=1 FL=1